MDVLVVGGGIGGLAAAAFQHRAGVEAAAYEQAAQLKEVGAGVVVAPYGTPACRIGQWPGAWPVTGRVV